MATKKTAYVVTLTKKLRTNDYPSGFFPHTYRLKRDALALVAEIHRKGGDAKVERTSRCPYTSDGEHVHIAGSKKCNVCEANRLLEDDRRNRTPDAELDPSEREDQPEEVERNRRRTTECPTCDQDHDQRCLNCGKCPVCCRCEEGEKRPDPYPGSEYETDEDDYDPRNSGIMFRRP